MMAAAFQESVLQATIKKQKTTGRDPDASGIAIAASGM